MTVANSLRHSVTDYSAKIGLDSMLVQGAGGNVSWKDGDTLWIKASGTWLADAKVKDIFVPVDMSVLQKEIKAGNFAAVPKVKGTSKLRPSIETLLHAIMPHRVVVHVHAIEVLAYLVRKNAAKEIKEQLGSLSRWAIVSYQKPGEALAKAVANALVKLPDTQIILLQNHGVVIGGDSIEEVSVVLSALIEALSLQPIIPSKIKPIPVDLSLKNGIEYKAVVMADIHNLAQNATLFERIKSDWALYPDHIVFLGRQATFFESVEQLEVELDVDSVNDLIFLKGLGVYTKGGLSAAKQAQLQCYYDVIVRQSEQIALQPLNKQQIAQLLDWDAERYRQQMAK